METVLTTPFSSVYKVFYSKITDDFYMELTPSDTDAIVEELLLNAIPHFEFPRVDIFDYSAATDFEEGHFNVPLSNEEINIIATYMVYTWLSQQIASVENVRMKYSGSDFKFTSQANHIDKLIKLREHFKEEGFHLQRLYKKRRKEQKVRIVSIFSDWVMIE